MAEAILSLGTNMGERLKNIENAIESISRIPETRIIKISNFYETEPFGVPDKQDKYINCCIRLSTDLAPEILLGACLGVEAALGRVRSYKFGPRIIDIDLLIYDHEYRNEKNLVLPHPRIKERAFVMIPLNDVCENMQFGNVDFKESFENCDASEIKLLKKLNNFIKKLDI